MKRTEIIKFRVTPDEKASFESAVKTREKTASEVLRDTVLRWAKRHRQEKSGEESA